MDYDKLIGTDIGDEMKGMISSVTGKLPGIDEAMSLSYIVKIIKTFNFDKVVFDTAPTGHTLRLLSLPKTINDFLSKIVKFKEKMGGMVQMMK